MLMMSLTYGKAYYSDDLKNYPFYFSENQIKIKMWTDQKLFTRSHVKYLQDLVLVDQTLYGRISFRFLLPIFVG